MTEQTFVPIGTVGRFPIRIGVRVRLPHLEAAVFRLSDGRIFALENKNPHRKGGVISEGMVSGEYLYDPLYDWRIHIPTGRVQEPDTGEVRTLAVKIDNGVVLLAG